MLLWRRRTWAGTLYRSEREGIVSSVGWMKWSVSGGGGGPSASDLVGFSSWALWVVVCGDGLYGGGASSAVVCEVVLDVAES